MEGWISHDRRTIVLGLTITGVPVDHKSIHDTFEVTPGTCLIPLDYSSTCEKLSCTSTALTHITSQWRGLFDNQHNFKRPLVPNLTPGTSSVHWVRLCHWFFPKKPSLSLVSPRSGTTLHVCTRLSSRNRSEFPNTGGEVSTSECYMVTKGLIGWDLDTYRLRFIWTPEHTENPKQ